MQRLPSLLANYCRSTNTQNFQFFCSILKADRSYWLQEFRYNTCPVHVHGSNLYFIFWKLRQFSKSLQNRRNLRSLHTGHTEDIWASSSEFVSSSIPSWQILTAHAQPFRRGQGSGFLSEGSSWLTACMSEQRRFWRDCADAQARLNLRCSHRR